MVSEVWDSLKWDRWTGFQAANEKTAAFWNVAEAVDKKEWFFVRALRSVTGWQIERKMFATYMRNQKWLENEKIWDVLHTLNSNNFSGWWSAFITQPFISASNWSPKAWKIDTKNIKWTQLPVPKTLHDHPIDFIHLRVLINTVWNKRWNTMTDQTPIKDAINMNPSGG
jgi:hypothetical protein